MAHIKCEEPKKTSCKTEITPNQSNEYFRNVTTNIQKTNLDEYSALNLLKKKMINKSFYLPEFDAKGIISVVKSFKAKSSVDYLGINVKLLKIIVPYISKPLAFLINKCFQAGIFPKRIKYSEITAKL